MIATIFKITASCMLVFCGCSMSPIQPDAGGGIETGNTKIVGKVLASDGVSLRSMSVSVYSDAWEGGNSLQYRAPAALDDSGYYTFDSLATGRYRVSSIDSMGSVGFSRTFAVVPQSDSMFVGIDSLRKVSCVKGKITRYDGSSAAGIVVALRGTPFKQTVNADGTFNFPRVPPGQQILIAQANWLYKGIPQLQTIFATPGDTIFVAFFLPAEHTFTLSLLPGQVWSYRYEFQFGPKIQLATVDFGFIYYAYVKDTTMSNVLFHVIRQWGYAPGFERTILYSTNYLYIGINKDTVLLYETYGTYSMPALLKRASLNKESAPGALADPVKVVYDTSVFYDFRIPVIFGMTPNKPWYSRPLADQNEPLIQRYVGNEIVSTEGGTFNCMRMEWVWAEETPVKGINYISDIGMVKQIIEDSVSYNSTEIDSAGIFYQSQYIGTDTTTYKKTFPRLPQTIYDSIQNQVMSHWNIGRYKRWIQAVDTSLDSSTFYSPSYYVDLWNTNRDPLYNLLSNVRPKFRIPLIDFSILADTLLTLSDTLSIADIQNPESFIHMLIAPSTRKDFAQGWDDCDWDFATKGLSNPRDTLAPYGRSEKSMSLFELLNGYYLYIQ